MSDERDTRVEELRAGDQVRYLGEWLDVVKVRQGLGSFPITSLEYLYDRNRSPKTSPTYLTGPYIALELDDGRTVMFPRGWFVAAECNPRPEAVPA